MWIKAATHTGQRRANNQDTYRTGILPDGGYIMVCDGMGGENGGNVASQIAADTAAAVIERDVKEGMGEISVRRVLEVAGAAANAAVYDKAKSDPSLKGMGTTLDCAVITGKTAHILHAGDSRVYLLRDDLLSPLTTDHTVVQMLLERGDITAEAAKTHPQRNYITRAVGVERDIRFDIFTIDLQSDDALLACSDGLYNYIGHNDLCALTSICVKQHDVQPLIDLANENGGGDNITAVLCCLEKEDA